MTVIIFDSIIAYFTALGLFVVIWAICGWLLGYWRWFVGKRNRNG